MTILWREDEATTQDPDHETLDMAYKRLFGEPFDRTRARHEDHGDHDKYFMPNGVVVTTSYPGNNSITK